MNKKLKQSLSLMIVIILMLSMFSNLVSAINSIEHSASTNVTVVMGKRNEYLRLSNGNTLGGEGWTYTTDKGVSGGAYCINHGLSAVNPTKKLQITGMYSSSYRTVGAFSVGHPRLTIDEFQQQYGHPPELWGLTTDEYAYATQVAVWATLGQVAVEGTYFTTGRDYLPNPTSGTAQQKRIFRAIELILQEASAWSQPLNAGMNIKISEENASNYIEVLNSQGLDGASKYTESGIRKETINGVEYYTREFIASSATANWKHEDIIELWSENAPNGTIFTDANNIPLETVVWDGKTLAKLPTDWRTSVTTTHGFEFAGNFKICLPVLNTEANGKVTIGATSTVALYNIYLATNPVSTEQSYILADPAYSEWNTFGELSWQTIETVFGKLNVKKVDGNGQPLMGAMFELVGADGTSFTGTSDANGDIKWDRLTPNINYLLKEIKAPSGYMISEARNITVQANEIKSETVKNDSTRKAIIKKVDTQNGSPLMGATFRFEQIDGSYKTDRVTGHDGIIDFSDIPYGNFKIFELESPKGYKKDETIQTVNWDGKNDVLLNFKNTREFSLRIIKVDEETQVSLSGATFNVYRDGKLITTVTTDDAGYASVSGISEGYFEIEEKIAPAGYILNTKRHGIYLDPYNPETENDPVLMISNKKKPTLKIIKYDSQSLMYIPNTVFEIYKDTVLIGQYTTNSNGEINLTDLAEGTYTVKEIAVDNSHIVKCSPQQVEIKAGQSAQLIFLNDLKPGMRITKLDSETLAPLAGVRFKISQVGGSYVQEFTTDSNGEIDLSNLAVGAYSVLEVATLQGYVIDNSERVIQLNPNENANFVFTNTKKPTMKIVKVSADGSKPLEGATFRIAKTEDGTRYFDRITDKNGIIQLDNMDIGIFSVQELVAPENHLLDDTEYHVETFAGQMSQLVVRNRVKPSLKIIKYDSQTNERLPNTTFEVYLDTTLIGTYTTDRNGEINLTGLSIGTYTVKEIATDDNHIVNSTPQQIEIKADSKDTAVLVFINQQKPYIRILKLDSKTMQPLPNAKFLIKQISGGFTKEYITDENGEIKLEKLPVSSFSVEEIQSPDGYLIDTPNRVIDLKGDEYATFIFTNSKKPSLKITKSDAISNEPLPNTVFIVKKVDGEVVATVTTDEKGEVLLEDLDPAIYEVKEQSVPSTHLLDTTPQFITLFPNKSGVLHFKNYKKPTLTLYKEDSITKDRLKNAKFEIWKAVNNSLEGELVNLGTYTTDEDGKIFLPDMESTWIRCIEVGVPQGYAIKDPTPHDIFLRAGENAVLHIENQPLNAIVIRKSDFETGEMLAGARFLIRHATGESGSGGTIIGEYTTSKNGTIVVTGLQSGAYVCEEVLPPSGYILNENAQQTVWLKEGETSVVEVSFTNKKNSGLLIKKMDANNFTPLSEVTFLVTDSSGAVIGDSNGEFRTDETGCILIPMPSLKLGSTVVVRETKTKDGYILDNTSKTIKIEAGKLHVLEFFNTPESQLIVQKKNQRGEALSGVKFKITRSDGSVIGDSNGEFVTDNDGLIRITGLLPNITVVVQEIAALDGYVLDDSPRTVKIEKNKVHTVEVINQEKSGLQIIKRCSQTGKVLSNAKFRVEKMNGEFVGEYTTNSAGIASVGQVANGWLKIYELRSPSGYILNSEPQFIEIKGKAPVLLEFINDPIASLQIKKLSTDGEPLNNVEFEVRKANGEYIGNYTTNRNGLISLDLENGFYTVVETRGLDGYKVDKTSKNVEVKTGKLANVTVYNEPYANFVIKKVDEDGNGLQGAKIEVYDRLGHSFGTFTTDRNGKIYVDDLEVDGGKYVYLRERKAPEGFVLDETEHEVRLNKDKMTTYEFVNKKMASILFRKIDAETKKGIYGAEFLFYDSNNNPLGEYKTDQDGYIKVTKGLKEGKYYIRELKVDGYVIDTQVKTVYVEAGKTSEITWENQPFKGQIVVTKRSKDYNAYTGLEGGSFLQGAVFEIYDRGGNLVDKITSNVMGIASSKPLKLGTYSVKEASAPKYFLTDSKITNVELNFHGQIVKFDVSNYSIKLGVSVKKVGNVEAMAGSTIRYDITNIANTSNTYLQNFYFHDGLPVDAVRGNAIVTGTYNQPLTYKIMYKTNMKDYRVLGEWLSTQQSYTFSLKPEDVGLMADEVITDITYEFGNVNQGFAQVETSYIYVDVLPWVSNEYRFTNRADVGGRYLEQWVIGRDSWASTVYRQAEIQVLPRTGY